MNIYNLPDQVEKALARYHSCFNSETGEQEVSDEEVAAASAALAEMENQSNDLIGWYLQDRANRLARAESFSTEIKRLKAHADRELKQVERAEMLIGRSYERIHDGKPTNIGTFTLSYRKSEAVSILDASIIPTEYLTPPKPQEPSPDKKAIKEAIGKGVEIP